MASMVKGDMHRDATLRTSATDLGNRPTLTGELLEASLGSQAIRAVNHTDSKRLEAVVGPDSRLNWRLLRRVPAFPWPRSPLPRTFHRGLLRVGIP